MHLKILNKSNKLPLLIVAYLTIVFFWLFAMVFLVQAALTVFLSIPKSFGASLRSDFHLHGYVTEPDRLILSDYKSDQQKIISLDGPVTENDIRSSSNGEYVVFRVGKDVIRGEFISGKRHIDSFLLVTVLSTWELESIFSDVIVNSLESVFSISNDGRKILAVLRFFRRCPPRQGETICGVQYTDLVIIDVIDKKGRVVTADILEL